MVSRESEENVIADAAQTQAGQGSTITQEESGLDRIKQARERAEKLWEALNG